MKLNRRQFTALAGAAALSLPALKASAAAVTLKLGQLANEENSWHKAALKFAKQVGLRYRVHHMFRDCELR